MTQLGGELAVTYHAAADLILHLSGSAAISKTKAPALFIMEFLLIFSKLWNFNYLDLGVKDLINRF